MRFAPKTVLGKWSVGLNAFFLAVIIVSILLVLVFGVLSFGDHWWDVTVPILVLTTLAGFVTGLLAVKKDRSVLVLLSIFVSVLAILFIFLHSLFIND